MHRPDDGLAASSLLTKTRELLQSEDAPTLLTIYNDTGLHPNWLSRLSTGKIPDPSVNRVQALYEYLSGRALTV